MCSDLAHDCAVCMQWVAASPAGMKNHLKRAHPTEWQHAADASALSLSLMEGKHRPCKACGKSPAPASQHKRLILFQLCMLRKLYGTTSQDNDQASHGDHERGGGDPQLLQASGAGHGLRRYFRPASSESGGQAGEGAQKQVAGSRTKARMWEGQHLDSWQSSGNHSDTQTLQKEIEYMKDNMTLTARSILRHKDELS